MSKSVWLWSILILFVGMVVMAAAGPSLCSTLSPSLSYFFYIHVAHKITFNQTTMMPFYHDRETFCDRREARRNQYAPAFYTGTEMPFWNARLPFAICVMLLRKGLDGAFCNRRNASWNRRNALEWKAMRCMQGVSTVGVGLVPMRMKNTRVQEGHV